MQIVHISIDEKFINSANEQFSSLTHNSVFYILSNRPISELKYVKKEENVKVVLPTFFNLIKLAKSISNSFVVFHGFTFKSAFLSNQFKKKQNNVLIWICWGAEFYANKALFPNTESFHNPMTLKYLNSKINTKSIKAQLLERLNVFSSLKSSYIKNRLSKIDYIGVTYSEQKEEINEKFNKTFSYFNFMYYPIEKMIPNLNVRINGNNILLGNSSSSTNNHLDVFEILKTMCLNDTKIITPLNYGDNQYRNTIVKEGTNEFAKNFIPLIDFMPLQDYNKLVQSCGIVIMNHKRQQAFGNIITMLYFGAKLYLSEQNSIYSYLKRNGIIVFSIEENLNSESNEALDNLSSNDQDTNRAIILQKFNSNLLSDNLSDTFNKLKVTHGY